MENVLIDLENGNYKKYCINDLSMYIGYNIDNIKKKDFKRLCEIIIKTYKLDWSYACLLSEQRGIKLLNIFHKNKILKYISNKLEWNDIFGWNENIKEKDFNIFKKYISKNSLDILNMYYEWFTLKHYIKNYKLFRKDTLKNREIKYLFEEELNLKLTKKIIFKLIKKKLITQDIVDYIFYKYNNDIIIYDFIDIFYKDYNIEWNKYINNIDIYNILDKVMYNSLFNECEQISLILENDNIDEKIKDKIFNEYIMKDDIYFKYFYILETLLLKDKYVITLLINGKVKFYRSMNLKMEFIMIYDYIPLVYHISLSKKDEYYFYLFKEIIIEKYKLNEIFEYYSKKYFIDYVINNIGKWNEYYINVF